MNKKILLKMLDLASFIAIIVATTLVLIFQFSGSDLTIKCAMVMYMGAFLFMGLYYFLVLGFGLKKATQDGEIVVDKPDKKQITLLSVKGAFSVAAFIFTLVIIILYA